MCSNNHKNDIHSIDSSLTLFICKDCGKWRGCNDEHRPRPQEADLRDRPREHPDARQQGVLQVQSRGQGQNRHEDRSSKEGQGGRKGLEESRKSESRKLVTHYRGDSGRKGTLGRLNEGPFLCNMLGSKGDCRVFVLHLISFIVRILLVPHQEHLKNTSL